MIVFNVDVNQPSGWLVIVFVIVIVIVIVVFLLQNYEIPFPSSTASVCR